MIGGGSGGAVEVSGTVDARGRHKEGGKVAVSGNTVALSGKLDASGRRGGRVTVAATSKATIAAGTIKATGGEDKGGVVIVTAPTIELGRALVDVSGGAGGGDVRIGGDFHGGGTITQAASLRVDAGTIIRADAKAKGDGGTVVLWSDERTHFAGLITARGGAQGGNGGEVEVSGKAVLDYTGFTDLSAANGRFGDLLLDPFNVTISNGVNNTGGSFTANTNDSIINATTLMTALAGGNVTIATGASGSQAGTITIAAPLTWSTSTTLTLNAAAQVAINAPVTITGGGGLTITAVALTGVTSTGLVFGSGGSVNYGATDNGGTFSLGGTAYTLIYSMANLDAIDGLSAIDGSAVTTYGAGSDGAAAGKYALATSLNAAGTTYTRALFGTNNTNNFATRFSGHLEGLGNTITGLTTNITGAFNSGPINFIDTNGVVSNLGLVDASITAAGNTGGLAGRSQGTIQGVWITGSVTGTGSNSSAGGLVGFITGSGTVQASYSTATVTGAATGTTGVGTGGLVGYTSTTTATVRNSFASGAVNGGNNTGGLIGQNSGTVQTSYATGAVTSSSAATGGLIGLQSSGTLASLYWDTQTTGRANGIGTDNNSQSANVAGRTTAQLQGALPAGFSTAIWATGTGLYPYLTSLFPSGVQAVSGIAYKDAGVTPLASIAAGAATVTVMGNGSTFGSATTGANGYYYAFRAAGTLANGNSVLAYTSANGTTGATNAASLATSTGGTAVSGLAIYGSTLSVSTSATLLSTALSGFTTAANGNATALAAIDGASGRRVIASGASFTVDQAVTTSSTFLVQTTAGSAPITVSQPITIGGSGSLALTATGLLTIGSPVTVSGAGAVSLTAAAVTGVTTTGLVFGAGASINYGATNNGGTFSLNGTGYTLVYSMSNLDSVDSVNGVSGGALTRFGGTGVGGTYALATDLDATGTTYTRALIGTGTTTAFSGRLEGLGHTITGLTISAASTDYIGLISNNKGIVSNIGLVGGTVTGRNFVGSLVGYNQGGAAIVQSSFASTTVGGNQQVGGLVGGSWFNAIVQSSYATGAVSAVNRAGGLIGETNFAGTTYTSYATGTVTASGTEAGGLVGRNDGATLQNSFATGAVSAPSRAGGLAGENGGGTSIMSSYATGAVTGTTEKGGLIGFNNGGTLTNTYWDIQTSGIGASQGVGNVSNASGVTGLTTAQLQGTLPTGFSTAVWGTGTGLYPYLTGITTTSVSGIAYNADGSVLVGATIAALLNGTTLGSGTATTNASGFYSFSVSAGLITSGSGIFVDIAGNSVKANSYVQGANGSVQNLDLRANTLTVTTTAMSLSAVASGIATAKGSTTAGDLVFTTPGGVLTPAAGTGITITASGAFAVDQVLSAPNAVLVKATGNLTIAAAGQVVSAGGNATLVTSGAFINDRGSDAISATGGRWLVYSTDPANDTRGGLDHAFKQYGATYGVTAVAQGTGNGLLYTVAPTVTAGLTGTVTKTYDGNATATLTPANFTASGALDNDTVTFSSTGATYANANAGTSKSVSATGVAIASATNGSVAVYGYALASTTASGNIGTIDPATLTYTTDAATRTYGASNPTFTGTVTGFVAGQNQGNATTGTLVFATTATAGSNVGSYAIDGSGLTANNGNYVFVQAAANATALSVTPATLTYTADAATRTYGASNPAFTGTVTGFVLGQNQAGATTGTLAFTTAATSSSNVGSYAIDGSGLTANNGNYVFVQAAGNATALTVNPATLTYTANAASRTYGASNPAFSGTVTGFVLGQDHASATSGTLAFTTAATANSNVGSYAVDGSGLTANNGNYVFVQAASNTTALDITPATLTYTANVASRTYGASNPAFTGSVTGFVLGQDQASATTGTLAFTTVATASSNVGSYAVDGSGLTANNGNYVFAQAAGNATALAVTPATLTYTADAATRIYGASNPAFTGTVTGFVLGQDQAGATTGTLAFTTAATSSSNVGSYAIDGSGLTANNGNYVFAQAAGNATALTVDPATLTYTADAVGRTYGSSNPTFSGTVTGFVLGQNQAGATTGTLAFTTAATSSSNVGSYAIDGSGLTANSGNYVFVQAAGNATALTVNPATLTYTADAVGRTYGSSNPTFSGTVTGFVLGQNQAGATTGTLAFTTPATSSSNVGSYAIDGSGLTASNGNYVFAQAAANATALTINPATLTYTADAVGRTYGSSNPAFSGTVTGFVLGQNQAGATTGTLAFTTGATSSSNVGSYAIDGSGLTANNGNYVFVQAAANATALTVNPATLTYTADAVGRTYGASNPAFTGSVTGFVLGQNQASATTGTLVFTTAATANDNVGSYAIDGSGLTANNGNYVLVQAAANATALTVNPATLTYTADAKSRTYGASNPALSGTVTGFVLGQNQAGATTGTLAFTTAATANDNVGSYAIDGSGLTANNGNYVFVQAAANATALTVNPATLTYTADAVGRTYGSPNPGLTGTVTGFVLGQNQAGATTGTLAFTTAATANDNVGSYAIDGSGLTANNGNYVFVQAAANATALTVNPATLTYTADAASRTYGSSNPAFTGTVTGFVLGQTQAGATTGTLAFTTAATANDNVGNYAITGSGLTANNGNYVFTQAAGNGTALAITPAALTYTADPATRTVGTANPAFTGAVTGFVLGQTQATATTGVMAFTSPAVAADPVGSYAIDGSGLVANNGNYLFLQASSNATALTVTGATTVTTTTTTGDGGTSTIVNTALTPLLNPAGAPPVLLQGTAGNYSQGSGNALSVDPQFDNIVVCAGGGACTIIP